MAKENKKSRFMEKSRKYLKSKNFKKLCLISPENKKGVKLPANLSTFEEGLKLFVGHIRQVKKKKHQELMFQKKRDK